MSSYDNIAFAYEKWSSGDEAYVDTLEFYTSILKQMNQGKYLELGIGSGRISIEVVATTPVSIVGIDESEKMLEICERVYRKLKPCKGCLTLRQGDFTHLLYHEKFDGAIMPFRTIGHILTDVSLDRMFHGVFEALKPGGWFLFDHYMFHEEWAREHNDTEIIMYKGENMTICDEYHYHYERNQMNCKVKINDHTRMEFEFRWFQPETLQKAAERAGFHILALMGKFDGTPWKWDSPEQIWLLRKPGTQSSCQTPESLFRIPSKK